MMRPEGGGPDRPTEAVRNTFKFKIAPHKQNSIVHFFLSRKMALLANGALCTMVNSALILPIKPPTCFNDAKSDPVSDISIQHNDIKAVPDLDEDRPYANPLVMKLRVD